MVSNGLSTIDSHENKNKSPIMNGIKKVFSHNRNSTSSMEDDVDQRVSPNTSPKSVTSNLSSENNTSVDSHEATSPKKGNTTSMAGAAAGTGKATTTAKDSSIKTGPGRSETVATADGSNRHSHGHNLANADLSQGKVTQTVEHLAGITSKTHHTHNIEEVERQRELERHQHHIQVHHQPIKHEEHAAEKQHVKAHPVTKINEKHASTDKDAQLLASVAHSHGHRDEVNHAPVQHQIVDKGEQVKETVHHHIHNVVVPLVSHDAHEHHRIKTTIPTHHVLHEAPIIHQATTLEPVSREEFLKRGGVIDSTKAHVKDANLLHNGTCERKVDGVAEKLAKELKLGNGTPSTVKAT